MTPMQITSAQPAPINRDALALFKLIDEQQKALKAGNHGRATEIEREMVQNFSGWPCLECGCEGHLHTPQTCAGKHGDKKCPCKGLRLEVTNANVGGVPASELFPDLDPFANIDILSSCTRKDLVESGDMIDITIRAAEAGITVPVVVSKAAWWECVEWTEGDSERKGIAGQTQDERLADFIRILRYELMAAARRVRGNTFNFKLDRVPRDGDSTDPSTVELKVVESFDPDGARYLTVLEPDED